MRRNVPFILLLSETSAHLLCPDGTFHDAQTSKDEPVLLRLIDRAPDTGVLFVLDHAGQTYIPTQHPALKRRDAKLLLERRVAEAFPDALYRAALLTAKGGAVLAGVEDCASLQRWRQALAERPNPFLGATLLPVECAGTLQRIATKEGAELMVFPSLGQRIRLVVIRDGRFFYARHIDAEPAHAIDEEADKIRTYIARYGIKQAETVFLPRNAMDKILLNLQRTGKAEHRFFLPAEKKRYMMHRAKRLLDAAMLFLFLIALLLSLREAVDFRTISLRQEQTRGDLAAASTRLDSIQKETPETPVDQLRAALLRDQIFTQQPDSLRPLLDKLGSVTNADVRLYSLRYIPPREAVIEMRFLEETARDVSRLALQNLAQSFEACDVTALTWPQERLSSDKPKDDPAFVTATFRLTCAEEK